MMPLQYKKVNGYLYEVEDDIEIPYLSKKLKDGLMNLPEIQHSFFTIKNDSVIVSKGYAWDGATGALVNSRNLVVPSLIHDIGCQAVNLELLPFKLRHCYDREYYEQSLLYGVNPIRAKIHYLAISLWGKIRKKGSVGKYSKHYQIVLKE